VATHPSRRGDWPSRSGASQGRGRRKPPEVNPSLEPLNQVDGYNGIGEWGTSCRRRVPQYAYLRQTAAGQVCGRQPRKKKAFIGNMGARTSPWDLSHHKPRGEGKSSAQRVFAPLPMPRNARSAWEAGGSWGVWRIASLNEVTSGARGEEARGRMGKSKDLSLLLPMLHLQIMTAAVREICAGRRKSTDDEAPLRSDSRLAAGPGRISDHRATKPLDAKRPWPSAAPSSRANLRREGGSSW
jgi:hypothetical protein